MQATQHDIPPADLSLEQHVAVAHASSAFINWRVFTQGNVTSDDGFLEPKVTAKPPGLKPNPVANTGQLMSFQEAYCHK